MNAVLLSIVVLCSAVVTVAANPFQVDPKIKVPVADIRAKLAAIKPGMARAEVGKVLGADWGPGMSVTSGGGEGVTYENRNFPGHGIHMSFRLNNTRGDTTPEDPLASIGDIYRFDRMPVEDAAAPSQPSPSMTPERFVTAYEEALRSQDWDTVAPLIHEDCVATFSSGTYKGKREVEKIFRHNFGAIKSERYAITNVHWVKKTDAFAVFTFDFQWSGIIDGHAPREADAGVR